MKTDHLQTVSIQIHSFAIKFCGTIIISGGYLKALCSPVCLNSKSNM